MNISTTLIPNTTLYTLTRGFQTMTNATKPAGGGDKPYPPLIKKIGLSVIPIIIFLAVFGNSLVIHLSRKYSLLKGPMRLLVINLSICNIILCFFPLMYIVELATGDWHFGSKACDGLVVFEYAALTSAKMTLVCIALERYTALLKPFKKKVSASHSKWMLLVAWLIGWPFAIPFVILQPRYVDDDHPDAAAQPECNNMWAVTTVGMTKTALGYYSMMFVVLYITPMLIMSFCYFRVIHVVLNKMKRPGDQTDKNKADQRRQKWRTIKMLITTVIIFQVCWLPSYIQEFLLAGGLEKKTDNLKIQVVNLICGLIGYLYCVLTPVIYFIFNQKYRKALVDFWHSLGKTIRKPLRSIAHRGTLSTDI
eukprot:gene11231-12410_t